MNMELRRRERDQCHLLPESFAAALYPQSAQDTSIWRRPANTPLGSEFATKFIKQANPGGQALAGYILFLKA